MPPPRALNILTHPRQLGLPVKRNGLVPGYGSELDARLYQTIFTMVYCRLPHRLRISANPVPA